MMDMLKNDLGLTISPVTYRPNGLYTYLRRVGGGGLRQFYKNALNIKNYSKCDTQSQKSQTFLLISTECNIDEMYEVLRPLSEDIGNTGIRICCSQYPRVSCLYDIVSEVNSDELDVVSLIIDDALRLEPSIMRSVIELRTQNIFTELKDFAIKKQIPVITSVQLGCNEVIDGSVPNERLHVIKNKSDEVIGNIL